MRRFILHSGTNPDKAYECVRWTNGEVNINIHPVAYRTHFGSLTEFQAHFPDDSIEWIDARPEQEDIRTMIREEVDTALKAIIANIRLRR